MKLIVAGTRTFRRIDVGAIIKECGLDPGEVVTGAAPGIDSLASDWALREGIPVKQFPPDWNKYGRAAGPIRNAQMAEYGDALLAIWDGKSRGTRSMIEEAKKRGLPIYQRTFTAALFLYTE